LLRQIFFASVVLKYWKNLKALKELRKRVDYGVFDSVLARFSQTFEKASNGMPVPLFSMITRPSSLLSTFSRSTFTFMR